MKMSTITIPLDYDLAQVYNTAPAEDQEKIQVLLSLWLREMMTPGSFSLSALMDSISDRAQARGLTPKILESLLDNDE
jgi:hypothetical protein